MIFVLDTCSLINLCNGGILLTVLGLPNKSFYIGPSVGLEAKSLVNQLNPIIGAGLLLQLDSEEISAVKFLDFKTRFRLGDGETESMTGAFQFGYNIVCDDAAARKAASELLGDGRVTGSIGLLRLCVKEGVLTADAGVEAYRLMLKGGAFLPRLSPQELFP